MSGDAVKETEIRNLRCVALATDGRRCSNAATVTVKYHGDDELYGVSYEPKPGWVLAHFCEKHADDSKQRKIRGHILERW